MSLTHQDQRRPIIVFSLSWDGASSLQIDTYMPIIQRHFFYMAQRNEADIPDWSASNFFSILQDASMPFAETMNRRLKRGMQQLHSQPLSSSLVLELVD